MSTSLKMETADNYKDELVKQPKELDIHKYNITTSYKKIEDTH